MGVGIFAARKIALLNAINNLEMMMTQLSSRQMQLSQESMNIAMQQNNLQSSALSMVQTQKSNPWAGIGQCLGGLGSLAGGEQYGNQLGSLGAGIGAIGGSIWAMNNQGGADPTIANKQQQLALDNKLLELQQQEKRLELTMKTLETQLNMKNQEVASVEKAEEKAIQRSAPKYGEA